MTDTITPWEFIELVARGNTEISELEAMADSLMERKAQLAQAFPSVCTQFDGPPGGTCFRCGLIAYEHSTYELECQGCKFGLATNHNLGLTCVLSQGKEKAKANARLISAPKLHWESKQGSGISLSDWRVEAVDFEHEGVVYVAVFSGPDAELRAKEYAALKNAGLLEALEAAKSTLLVLSDAREDEGIETVRELAAERVRRIENVLCEVPCCGYGVRCWHEEVYKHRP